MNTLDTTVSIERGKKIGYALPRRGPLEIRRYQVFLVSAFWQVSLWEQDRENTGIPCELGVYQWESIPFGICNAMATFQRLMAQALTSITKKYGNLVMCCVNDVVVATPTLTNHIDRLDQVCDCMKM